MSIDVTRILSQIHADEGYRSIPYLCSAGVWTTGIGTTSIHGVAVTKDTAPISVEAALSELKSDVLDAQQDACELYSTYDSYTPRLQEILVMLVFQLGKTGLSKFVRMNAAIRSMDVNAWVAELIDSRLYRQSTNRIDRYITTLKAEPSYA